VVQPARRFDVWRRLYTRFLIEPFPAGGEGPSVLTTIAPVTDADRLLQDTVAESGSIDIQASAGTFVAAQTVPNGQRWNMVWVRHGGTVADTQQVVRIGGVFVTISATGTNAISQSIVGVRLNEGDAIGLLTTGNAGDAAVNVQTIRDEEDAF